METSNAAARSNNPSGRRGRGEPHYRAEDSAEAFAGLPDGVRRFDLMELLEAVGKREGWTDPLLGHFRLLLRFTRDEDWTRGSRPIVYLSVKVTAKMLDVSPSQVRRNERRLMELGALSFCDSGNHHRYGKRDEKTGRIVFAYGVDLSPAAELLPALAELAAARERTIRTELRLERETSAARRDVLAALDRYEGRGADALRRRAAGGPGRSIEEMELRLQAVRRLDRRLRKVAGCPARAVPERGGEAVPPDHNAWADRSGETAMLASIAGQDASPGKHACLPIHNTQESLLENNTVPNSGEALSDHGAGAEGGQKAPGRRKAPTGQSLASFERFVQLLDIAPESLARSLPNDERLGWDELVRVVGQTALRIGISLHTWGNACQVLGERQATAAVIVIAAKREQGLIASPGGYLRAMVRRFTAGELRLEQSIRWLQAGGGTA